MALTMQERLKDLRLSDEIFVFQTKNLDLTIERLKEKGVPLSEAIRYDWGTHEVRLNDIDGNEIVIVEFA